MPPYTVGPVADPVAPPHLAGYVPWCEYKNLLKRLTAKTAKPAGPEASFKSSR